MANYYITKHGKTRMSERADMGRQKDIQNIFKKALNKGYSPADFPEPLQSYLKSKSRNGSKLKVYDDKIFIYKNHTLITSYPFPQERQKELTEFLSMKSELENMTNDEAKSSLLSDLGMLISLLKIQKSVGLYENSFEQLENYFNHMIDLINILVLRLKIQNNADKGGELSDTNIIQCLESVSERMTERTTNLSDRLFYEDILPQLLSVLNYIHEQKFFIQFQ